MQWTLNIVQCTRHNSNEYFYNVQITVNVFSIPYFTAVVYSSWTGIQKVHSHPTGLRFHKLFFCFCSMQYRGREIKIIFYYSLKHFSLSRESIVWE